MSNDDETVERVARAILANMIEIESEIAGRPVEADEFAEMCAFEYARAALSALPPRDELLREALEWIVKHYANQDMSHMDFRVEAYARALEALKGAP